MNSSTNLLFLYLAYRGIRSCIQHGHDTIFLVSFVGYLLVGMGSFLFHATLKCTSKPDVTRRFGKFGSDPVGATYRSNATRRRTQYDIHHLFDVLCFLLLFAIPPILPSSGPWPRILGTLHHVLLSLSTRSGVPSTRIYDLDRGCHGTWHLCHGKCLAALFEDARSTAPRRR